MPLQNKKNVIKTFIAVFLILGQGFFCFAQTKSYAINKENSQITFQVKHLGVLTVHGTFIEFSGRLTLNDDTLEAIESVIKVNSIDTNDKSRDNTLISDVYLNAAQFPDINFQSTKIQINSDKKILEGLLKIKDVEKNIETSFLQTKDEKDKNIRILTTLSRKDFNLNFGSMNSLIGDEIKVEIIIVIPNN